MRVAGIGAAIALVAAIGFGIGYAAGTIVPRDANERRPTPPSRVGEPRAGAHGGDGRRPIDPGAGSGARVAAIAPPARVEKEGRVVDATDTRLLMSREEVDRDLPVGVATNAAATRVVHDAKVRLFGDDGELSLASCFERGGVELPESLAVELELTSWPDEVAITAVRIPDAPRATEACVTALVGRVGLEAKGNGGVFASRQATVRLTVPVGVPIGE